MTYVLEPRDSVYLDFRIGPFFVPNDPLSLVLDFVSSDNFPPLPWEFPTLIVEYRAPLQRAGGSQRTTVLRLTPGTPADDQRGARWTGAIIADLETAAAFEDAAHHDQTVAGSWAGADAVQQVIASAWLQSNAVDRFRRSAWGKAAAKDRGDYTSHWIMKTSARDRTKALGWYTVNLTGSVYDDSAAFRALLNTDTITTVSLDGFSSAVEVTGWNEVNLSFGYVAPDRPIVPHDKTMRVTARQAAKHDSNYRAPWGEGQSAWQDWNLPYPVEPVPDEPDEPAEELIRRVVYQIMNTLQIFDVATSTPLDITDVRISLDIDSLSWKFSGTVYGAGSLALVRPDSNGMKDINVTINGHTWTFAIESYTSDEKFPTQKFALSGLSRTQYMAAPFAPIRSYTNTLATTAAQAATAELTNTGFELNWPTGDDGDLPDWPIPAGALSYRDKSPAQVIAQIVTAAGGIMVPSRAADAWTIQPRYTVAPWAWSEPDVIIYIGMVRSRSAKYEPAPAFDACYVSGINQGVAVDVQRSGSGGLNPMPDIYDDLITDQQPAISRGRAELSGAGNKVIETLSIMIPENGAAPGIVTPGQIAKITHDNSMEDYFALVLSTSISVQRAGGAEIYQSVTLERTA